MNQIQKQKLLTGMVRGFRIVLASVFIFSLGIAIPAQAAGEPDLVINLSHTGNFQFFSVTSSTEAYTISVTNSGGSPTNGTTVTVTDTLPAGLTADGISGTGWSCTLATLTCTRSDVLNQSESYPDITLTVKVDNDAPNSVDNQASVSGGGEIDTSNNMATDPTTIIKSELVITNVTLSPTDPNPNQAFNLDITVLNQGTNVTESLVFRHVYIDRNPSTFMDPLTGCPEEDGDYVRNDYNDGLPAGISDTKSVPIDGNLFGGGVTTPGLPPGSHKIWVYVDTNCVNNESVENNNLYGPIAVNVGGINTGPADVSVTIGNDLKGTYPMTSGQSMVQTYSGVNGGPVVIQSNNGNAIIASYLQLRRPGYTGGWTGITQTMALTDAQISDTYVFPRYDYTDPTKYNHIQLANFDSIATNVTVKIGGQTMGTYPIDVGSALNVNYYLFAGGPVVISSDNGAKIVASLYELKRPEASGLYTGQTQMMGLPWSQLSDTYVIPRYNYTLQDLLPYLIFSVP